MKRYISDGGFIPSKLMRKNELFTGVKDFVLEA